MTVTPRKRKKSRSEAETCGIDAITFTDDAMFEKQADLGVQIVSIALR